MSVEVSFFQIFVVPGFTASPDGDGVRCEFSSVIFVVGNRRGFGSFYVRYSGVR